MIKTLKVEDSTRHTHMSTPQKLMKVKGVYNSPNLINNYGADGSDFDTLFDANSIINMELQ